MSAPKECVCDTADVEKLAVLYISSQNKRHSLPDALDEDKSPAGAGCTKAPEGSLWELNPSTPVSVNEQCTSIVVPNLVNHIPTEEEEDTRPPPVRVRLEPLTAVPQLTLSASSSALTAVHEETLISEPVPKKTKKWKLLLKKYKDQKTKDPKPNDGTPIRMKSSDRQKPSNNVSREVGQKHKKFLFLTAEKEKARKISVPDIAQAGSESTWNGKNFQLGITRPFRSSYNSVASNDLADSMESVVTSPGSPCELKDGAFLHTTDSNASARVKSSSPEQRSSKTVRRPGLQRGSSLSLLSNAQFANKSERRSKRSDARDPTTSQLSDDKSSRGNTERRKMSRITNEMRDKFSVFHRPAASCSPTPTTQQPSCASPTDRYRPLLSKIFQSHALNSGGVQAWGESFEHILHDKCGINVFREFLRTEFSDENIEFWLECEEFRNSSDQEDLQAKAQKIFNEFVAVQSKREINLDSNTRIQLEKELESANKYTFDQSQKRIQALMEKDSYCRFLRSDIYMAALELSRELNLTAQSHRLNDKIKASMAVFANLERASKQDYRRDSEEEGPESILTGLLPKVTSPKDMAVSSSQHTKGSNSVPSSPKQPRVTMAKSPAPIVLDA